MLDLSLRDGEPTRAGLHRREFLRIGSLGLGGLSLGAMLQARALAADAGLRATVKDRAVVLLFLAGGPSHIETFDPKLDAPEGVRGVTGELATTIPGVTFGGTFPGLATRAGKLAIVRSFHHRINDHALAIRHVLTAGNPLGAGMGAVYARLRGPTDPDTALPTYGLITTEEVDGQYVKEKARVQEGSGPGPFGRSYAPFDPAAGGGSLDLMRLSIPRRRLEDRRALLEALDGARRALDERGPAEAMGRYERQAMDLILRNAGDALDLNREDPRVVARYDTSAQNVGHKRFRPCTLGRQLLTARRLVEAGCGFVTVQNAGWDMHADGNNPGMEVGMNMLSPPLDRAVSAFLDDLEARGLSERVLLVITGDFGRTPKLNKRGGRDHWASLSTLALAGGGLRMGQVIGRSTRQGDAPASEPVTPAMLMSTLMNVLFDLPALRAQPGVPREISAMLGTAEPIPGLT
ncbi:MAG: DUF1501 domain-containing protein [Isosphaeraceae bacterium]